ncbi:MAG: nucleoside hydrolase [Gemmatimonadales bacterium]
MIGRLSLGLAVLVVLALLTFALPIRTWRTGQLPAPPLPVISGGPAVSLPDRLWIDTDAACGTGRTTDPDDCFAILLLARAAGARLVGISSVHGNASLPVTDSTTRELMRVLEQEGLAAPPVYRGSAGEMGEDAAATPEPAHDALRQALEDGPLTLVSLGPLTNVAAALNGRPALQARVGRIIAVMGRRPGHLFHPAEGAGKGILFGHGPVFRDFNFDKDRAAATAVLRLGLPTTLIPYEAAREVSLTAADVARLESGGAAAAWVAARARGWLDFWKEEVGRDGFYPFDLLAGAYLVAPQQFNCAPAAAWVGEDTRLWHLFSSPPALMIGLESERPEEVRASGRVVYCPGAGPGMHGWLMGRLTGDG